jgi:hypothetical protein
MSVGRPWVEEEVIELKRLAALNFHAYDIARCIGRNPSSVYAKAYKIGLDLVYRTKRYPIPAGDRSTWDEAQRICGFANVPMPLAQLVVDVCDKHKLSVKSVRSQSRLGDHLKCRLEIAFTARQWGYSLPVIGRAISRDHTTVIHTLRTANSSTEFDKTEHVPTSFQWSPQDILAA